MKTDINKTYLQREPDFTLNKMQAKMISAMLNKYGWQTRIPKVEVELYTGQPKDLFEHSHPTHKGCLIRVHEMRVHIYSGAPPNKELSWDKFMLLVSLQDSHFFAFFKRQPK